VFKPVFGQAGTIASFVIGMRQVTASTTHSPTTGIEISALKIR
jgi:FlaG/FlaF family flagellin (archaellin)